MKRIRGIVRKITASSFPCKLLGGETRNLFKGPCLDSFSVIEMGEIRVKIPDEFDEQTISELEGDVRSVVRLRLAKEIILKRLDKILEDSTLTDEECLALGRNVKERVAEEWRRKDWL